MVNKFFQKHCDWCKKRFVNGEPIVIKVPELIYFCDKCCEKYPDEKVYPIQEWWVGTIWEEWAIITNE